MVKAKTSEIDTLIKELKNKKKELEDQFMLAQFQTHTLLWQERLKKLNEEIINITKQILELETRRAILLDWWSSDKSSNQPQSIKLWDVVIIPWICIIIGNYAISDYDTYDEMRNLFEKGIELHSTRETIKLKSTLLGKWQFSSWLKFLYAVVKYISSKDLKKEKNVYKLDFDDDFASFFKESGEMFAFINKENTDPKGRDLDYWKGPRNYCNKILWRCSNVMSIDLKERGKREMWFSVREQEK